MVAEVSVLGKAGSLRGELPASGSHLLEMVFLFAGPKGAVSLMPLAVCCSPPRPPDLGCQPAAGHGVSEDTGDKQALV